MPATESKIIRPRWPRRPRRGAARERHAPPHIQVAAQMGLLDPANGELFEFIHKIMNERQLSGLETAAG